MKDLIIGLFLFLVMSFLGCIIVYKLDKIRYTLETMRIEMKSKLGWDDIIMIALATFTIVCFILDVIGG